MATKKPWDEVAFNNAGENDGKFHSFCEKKLPNFCPETWQEQQTYNPKDDNCYLKIIC